jgi:hypothetical protein
MVHRNGRLCLLQVRNGEIQTYWIAFIIAGNNRASARPRCRSLSFCFLLKFRLRLARSLLRLLFLAHALCAVCKRWYESFPPSAFLGGKSDRESPTQPRLFYLYVVFVHQLRSRYSMLANNLDMRGSI